MPIRWIIGRAVRRLLGGLPGVTFLEYDKRSGVAGMRALRRSLQGRRFGALLQLQVAARANLLSAFVPARRRIGYDRARRSEEHTSELQSLMRISYAVFCLKKKIHNKIYTKTKKQVASPNTLHYK